MSREPNDICHGDEAELELEIQDRHQRDDDYDMEEEIYQRELEEEKEAGLRETLGRASLPPNISEAAWKRVQATWS